LLLMNPSTEPRDQRTGARPARARRGRWLLWSALGLLASAALAVWVGARSEPGTRWLLAQVPGLTAEGVQGSLLSGNLRIDALAWQGGAQLPTVRVDGLEGSAPQWQWRPHDGAWMGLTLSRLHAARVTWRSPVQPDPSAAAPEHLRLPFALHVLDLQIDALQIDDLSPLAQLSASLQLGADAGRQHRIDNLALRSERAQLRASARIDAQAPLALVAEATVESLAGKPWSATLQASGPLASLQARARLRGREPAGAEPALDAQARIEPFANWPLADLELTTRDLDLASLWNEAPATRIDASARIHSAGLDQPASASVRLDNKTPGRWDTQRLPLRQLHLELGSRPRQLDRVEISRIEATLADDRGAAGTLRGRGEWLGSRLRAQLQLKEIQPARLDARAGVLSVSGPLNIHITGLPAPAPDAATVKPDAWRARIDAALSGRIGATTAAVQTELAATFGADEIEVSRLVARAGDASASATFKASRLRDAGRPGWRVASLGEIARFNPLPWWPGTPGSAWSRGPHRIDGHWQFDVQWRDGFGELLNKDRIRAALALHGDARVEIRDSLLAGVPLAGRAQVSVDGRTLRLDSQLGAAGNQLVAQGQLAADPAQDSWQLDARLPALAALQPLWALLPASVSPQAWALGGDLQFEARATGRWPAAASSGQLRGRGLRARDATLASADMQWRVDGGDDGVLDVQVAATDLRQGEQRIDALQARVDGSRREHQIRLRAESPLRPPAWADVLLGSTHGGTRATLEAQGQWTSEIAGGGQWHARQAALRVGARQGNERLWIDASDLQGTVTVDRQGTPVQAQLTPGRALLPGGAALRWSEASWRASPQGPGRFDLRSELEPWALAPLLARAQPEIGWVGDLALAGRIEVHAAERFDADIVLERAGGDLRVADEIGNLQALGLTDLSLVLTAHDGVWQFAQGAAGQHVGEMAGAQVLRTTAQARWPARDAPLDGVLELRVANLGVWGAWLPPGWRLGGNLHASAALGGRFGAPELRGQLRGSELSVRNALQGVGLGDGELDVTLEGAVAQVNRFSFKGGEGRLALTGGATLGDTPSANLRIQAERFRALGRIDRRLVTSGSAELNLTRDTLRLEGRFVVDEGLIDFSRGEAPGLDGDVVVIVHESGTPGSPGATAQRAGAQLPTPLRNAQIALSIGLGEKLQLRGRGLDTRLRGELRFTSADGRTALNGTVRTEAGTYAAYAQKMTIERGELLFSGAVDNPYLNIVAVRPNLDVRVGVSVVGPMANPRVRLFSEPDMSEMEKLSWLVLGRSSEGHGTADTALLQSAAIALLAGEDRMPSGPLMEQLGLTTFSMRQSDSETRETIVSIGRQLSQRWYVGYERSVNATTGTWQLIYRVARRVTVRAQSGVENALDVIWFWRW
jgi:translocation and assembly module TamB